MEISERLFKAEARKVEVEFERSKEALKVPVYSFNFWCFVVKLGESILIREELEVVESQILEVRKAELGEEDVLHEVACSACLQVQEGERERGRWSGRRESLRYVL